MVARYILELKRVGLAGAVESAISRYAQIYEWNILKSKSIVLSIEMIVYEAFSKVSF